MSFRRLASQSIRGDLILFSLLDKYSYCSRHFIVLSLLLPPQVDNTALHVAAKYDYVDALEALIASRAGLEITNKVRTRRLQEHVRIDGTLEIAVAFDEALLTLVSFIDVHQEFILFFRRHSFHDSPWFLGVTRLHFFFGFSMLRPHCIWPRATTAR